MNDLYTQPLVSIALTVGAYAAAEVVHRRWPRVHPMLITMALLGGILCALRLPLTAYKAGGDILTFFLGPATIALGVPLYNNAHHLRRALPAILTGLLAGSLGAIGSVWAILGALHSSRVLLATMLPKSVTTPIAVEIIRQLHGNPELGATFVVLTGFLGALAGPRFLRLIGVRHDLAIGLAIGTAAHGMGTSSVVRQSELQGSAAGLAMALNGILTSLLMVPVYPYFA